MSYESPQDDVPVYDPLYPELEKQCAHPKCDAESPPNERLCSDCTNIMLDESPMVCQYCTSRRLASHQIPDEAIDGVESVDNR